MRIVVCIIILTSVLATESSARDLSLEQALILAREHSWELKRSRAESAAAENGIDAARARRLPTLSVVGNLFYISDIPTFDIEIPGGPNLSRELGSDDNYQLDLQASVPVWTGGRIGAMVNVSRATRDYRRALELATMEQVQLMARLQYLGLLRAEQLVDAAAASLERSHILRDDIESMYQAGAADSVDLLEVALVVTRAEFDLQEAKNTRRTTEIRLLILLGLDPSDKITPTTSMDPPRLPDTPRQVDSTKPELQAARASVELASARLGLSQSDYLPSLSVYGGYSYGKPNLDRFDNTWNDHFTVGARLTWNLNLFESKAEESQARFGLRAAHHQQARVHESLSEQAEVAWQELLVAYDRFTSARDEVDITRANYRLARAKHRDGALSSNRLLEIEATLSAAEASLAAAQVNVYVARSTYFYAIGSNQLAEGL